MLIDKLSQFAFPAAISTAAPGTSKFGDTIDLAVVGQDLGEGHPLYWYTSVAVTATSAGAATFSLQLVHADNEALTANVVVILVTGAVPVASLTQGTELTKMALPILPYKRWLGVRQVVGTAAFTAGSLYSFLTPTPQNWKAYPEGLN